MSILERTAERVESTDWNIDAIGQYNKSRQQFIGVDSLPLHITASGNGMLTYSATSNQGKDNDSDDKST